MNEIDLKHVLPFNEFDYPTLCNALKSYANIRAKIQRFLNTGSVIRVKKGLYVLGKKLTHGPISLEILANLIYGPSYISLDYALSFYHLIPERVYEVTSITLKRFKKFQTPLGTFSYRSLSKKLYPLGVQWVAIDEKRSVLMATSEKALIDSLYFSGIRDFHSKAEIESWLFEDKRLDLEALTNLDKTTLQNFRSYYSHRAILALIAYLTGEKDE